MSSAAPARNPVIREASGPDDDAIAAMAQEIVEAGDVFVFEAVEDIVAYWRAPGARVFVAEVEGEVLGTYVLKPNQRGRGAHVANAGYMVSAAARGLGLGRTMGEHSIELAKSLGYRAMQFNMVISTNAGAIHLWEKLGFEIVGRLPGAFRHRNEGFVDALVMYRTL